MGFHGRAAAHKPKITMRNVKHRLEWCKLDSGAEGNELFGVMNHASPSGSPTDESGFGGSQENAKCLNV